MPAGSIPNSKMQKSPGQDRNMMGGMPTAGRDGAFRQPKSLPRGPQKTQHFAQGTAIPMKK